MESPPQGYRPNVGICLINPSKKIFVASRLHMRDAWQMPQGGIDEGEDAQIAAIRELKEETGVTSVEVLDECRSPVTPVSKITEEFQHKSLIVGDRIYYWFLLKFLGNNDEINLLGDGKEKPEFGKWEWMSPEQVAELAVDFKRPVYEQVFKAFAPHLQ